MVLHLQDHFPFNHVTKSILLGCDIVGFHCRIHYVEGSRPSLLEEEISRGLHNFKSCDTERLGWAWGRANRSKVLVTVLLRQLVLSFKV